MEARVRGGFLLLFGGGDFFQGVRMGVGASGRVGEPSAIFSVLAELRASACEASGVRASCILNCAWTIRVYVGAAWRHVGRVDMLISAGSGPTPEFSPASCCAPWKMEPAPPAPAPISQPLNISPNGEYLLFLCNYLPNHLPVKMHFILSMSSLTIRHDF